VHAYYEGLARAVNGAAAAAPFRFLVSQPERIGARRRN
jgi:hypothetical protein